MSGEFEKEFICILHTQHECSYGQDYHRGCDLRTHSDFATASCPYRLEAVVLAAAKPVESPENVVQQGQPEKTADTMEAEIKEIF